MRSTSATRITGTETVNLDSLAIWSVNLTKRGKVRSIGEYLDTATGEIIPAEQLTVSTLDIRNKLPARDAVFDSLRPEVRKFASFVLKFANKRRGITPGIDALCKWYADLHGKRIDNVRRYVRPLIDAGVLVHGSLLGPLFQRTGGSARAHLSEAAEASGIYMRMLNRAKPVRTEKHPGAAPVLVSQEVARLDAELDAEREAWKAIRTAQLPVAAFA
ncbi:hypothetical protein ACIPRI_23170 [Variovorax sp. LARHSF232]